MPVKKRAPKVRSAKQMRAPAAKVGSTPRKVTMSTKGQVVIPSDVRNDLGWAEGDELALQQGADGKVTLSRWDPFVPKRSVDEVFGIGRKFYNGPPISIEDMDRLAREGFARRWGHEYDDEPRRKKKKRA